METNELISLLRDRLSITINVDSEWEGSGEYATFSVRLDYTDDDGVSQEISSDYDSVCINRDN